jgi:hypothetical protein
MTNIVWSAVAAVLFLVAGIVCAVTDRTLSIVVATSLAGVTCAILASRE